MRFDNHHKIEMDILGSDSRKTTESSTSAEFSSKRKETLKKETLSQKKPCKKPP